jgi:hypothetical protein
VLPAQAGHTTDWFVFTSPSLTDADGGFESSPLAPDIYRLVASAEDAGGAMLLRTVDVDARAGDVSALEVRLERATEVKVHLGPSGTEWRELALVGPDGRPLSRLDRDSAEGLPQRQGDPDGPFVFYLAAGRYRLQVDWGAAGRREHAFDVGTDALDVDVAP